MRLRTLERASRGPVRAGFTLMELLVVVAILLVLTSVAVPLYLNYIEQSKDRAAKATARMLAQELQNYYVSHDGNYPPVNDWTYIVLRDGVNPPLDPWGNPFQWDLQLIGNIETQIATPVVWSVGRDGISGTEDDIYSNQ